MADDFGKKVGDFGRNVWGKAQDAVDVVSLKNEINTKNRELNRIYAEIGEEYCRQQHSAAKKSYPVLTEKTEALEKEIDQLRDKIQRRKGIKKCPGCGEMILLRAAFCNKCGTRVPDPDPEDHDQLCRKCGKLLDDEDVFCSYCGSKR